METVILVVANDSGVREMLTQLFSSQGFCVSAVADETGALFQFGWAQPDLVILDMGPTSRDAGRILPRLRALSSVPIVVLCGLDTAAGVDTLHLGADAFVPWPVNPRELTARVLALLRRSRGEVLQSTGDRAKVA